MWNECPKGGEHNWTEGYYGHRCSKCLQFYAYGCAPWDEYVDCEAGSSDDNDCDHMEADYNILDGRATCGRCGFIWYPSPEAAKSLRND